MNLTEAGNWSGNWAWSLPLIALCVVIHVFGLQFINYGVVRVLSGVAARRSFVPAFAAIMGATALFATILHGIEVTMWALAYRFLGALSNNSAAMLYSLSAMTSYGHASIFLELHWQLMGALESLNGMLLFGLTTAFLFAMIQKVWPLENSGARERKCGSISAQSDP